MTEHGLHALRIVRDALDRAPAVRDQFVASCCGDDRQLLDRVDAMLHAIAADDLADIESDDVDAQTSDAAKFDSLVGTRLGPFRVLERVGRGGMGIIYRAEREGADFTQEVAIKLIRRGFDFDDVQRRFLRERRILSSLSHPNLARFIDGGVTLDGRPWFALEYVRGSNLTEWCDAKRLSVRQRVRIFLDVCAAVQYAHTQLIVHRDIKPGNVLVDDAGTVRLLDFGIARLLSGDDSQPGEFPTAMGTAALTPEFASPEQICGEAIGVASDVFALGAVLYFLLSDALPYALDPSAPGAGYLHAFDTPPPALAQALLAKPPKIGRRVGITTTRNRTPTDGSTPLGKSSPEDATGRLLTEQTRTRLERRSMTLRQYRHVVRGDLTRIVETALARETERRYPTVAAFGEDLQRWLHDVPVRVSGNRFGYRLTKFVRRNAVAVALSVVLAIALLGATSWALNNAANERNQRAVATREAARNLQIKDQLIALFLQPEDSRLGNADRTALAFLDQARNHLDKLPIDREVRGELAGVLVGIYTNLGEWRRAATLGDAALGGAPITPANAANADLRLVTGWATAQWVTGHTDGISIALTSAIEHARNRRSKVYSDALLAQTRIFIAERNFSDAVDRGEQALALLQELDASHADTISVRLELAAAYVGNRQTRLGRVQTERALKEVGPADSMLHVQVTTMAALRRALFGEFASAQLLFDDGAAQWQRLGINIPRPFTQMSRAVNAFDLGEMDSSISLLRAMLSKLPKSERSADRNPPDTDWLRGEILLHQGRHADAANFFSAAANHARHGNAQDQRLAMYCRALQSVALARAGRLSEAQSTLDSTTPPASSAHRADYASSAVLAAGAVLLSMRKQPMQSLAAFDRALAEFGAAARQPAILEDQLKENRDALRVRVWKMHAELDAGAADAAAATANDARRLGIATLGTQHPFMRELDALVQRLPAASLLQSDE